MVFYHIYCLQKVFDLCVDLLCIYDKKLQIIVILILGGKIMKQNEIPVGFAMALAMNPAARKKYESFSDEQKNEIISGTHAVKSKDEMHQYVNSILNK